MTETSDQAWVVWQFALNALWVLLPLVPAVLIYLIFPKSVVALKGPFSGLTIRASGAFAAYFIILLVTIPMLNRLNQNLENEFRPTWQISGSVRLQDENGKNIPYDNRNNSPLSIELDPKLVTPVGRYGFSMHVPEIADKIPAIHVRYPGVGTYLLDPMSPEEGEKVKIDHYRKKVEIVTPLIIRQEPCIGLSCDPEP